MVGYVIDNAGKTVFRYHCPACADTARTPGRKAEAKDLDSDEESTGPGEVRKTEDLATIKEILSLAATARTSGNHIHADVLTYYLGSLAKSSSSPKVLFAATKALGWSPSGLRRDPDWEGFESELEKLGGLKVPAPVFAPDEDEPGAVAESAEYFLTLLSKVDKLVLGSVIFNTVVQRLSHVPGGTVAPVPATIKRAF
eukprot:2520219-Rhodomonas_salina.1